MKKKELLMELGIEGGEVKIYRTPAGSGSWEFHVEGSSMFLDDKDDENWRSWASEPVPTLREALRSVGEGGSWVFFYPLSVHPECRTLVWNLAQETASSLPATRIELWEDQSWLWQRICSESQ